MNVINSTKLERDAGEKRHAFLLIPLRCFEIPLTTLTAGASELRLCVQKAGVYVRLSCQSAIGVLQFCYKITNAVVFTSFNRCFSPIYHRRNGKDGCLEVPVFILLTSGLRCFFHILLALV
jgi:hypothetical protein